MLTNDPRQENDLAVYSEPLPNCRILVRGMLDARWAEYIGELTLTEQDALGIPTAALTGFVPDQSALLGVLLYLNQFGMLLVAVEWDSKPAEMPEAQM